MRTSEIKTTLQNISFMKYVRRFGIIKSVATKS